MKDGRKGHQGDTAEVEEIQNGGSSQKTGLQGREFCQKTDRSHCLSEGAELRDCLFTMAQDGKGHIGCWKEAAERERAGCIHSVDRRCPVESDSSWRGDSKETAGLFMDVNRALKGRNQRKKY